MARLRDVYPTFFGQSTMEETIPDANDQAVLEQTENVPEKATVSKQTANGIVIAVIALVAVMLLLQFA